MLSLLYHRSGGKTARALAGALHITPLREAGKSMVVVRWGSSQPAGFDRAINAIGAIRLTANGRRSLAHLRDNDIFVPAVFSSPPEDLSIYPILGRRCNHRAGLDIRVCTTLEEAQAAYNTGESTFFTQLESVTMELGVHVFSGKVIKMFRKVPRAGDHHPLIRTSAFGWGYHRVSLSKYPDGQTTAISAIEVLGLTFGRVDLGWCPDARRYVVFEANTAPALNSATMRLYVGYLAEYIESLGEDNG